MWAQQLTSLLGALLEEERAARLCVRENAALFSAPPFAEHPHAGSRNLRERRVAKVFYPPPIPPRQPQPQPLPLPLPYPYPYPYPSPSPKTQTLTQTQTQALTQTLTQTLSLTLSLSRCSTRARLRASVPAAGRAPQCCSP